MSCNKDNYTVHMCHPPVQNPKLSLPYLHPLKESFYHHINMQPSIRLWLKSQTSLPLKENHALVEIPNHSFLYPV